VCLRPTVRAASTPVRDGNAGRLALIFSDYLSVSKDPLSELSSEFQDGMIALTGNFLYTDYAKKYYIGRGKHNDQ
jgi:hypothetical protein